MTPPPLRIDHVTVAAVRAGRLDASQAAELADMLDNAIDDPANAAGALGLLHRSKAELLLSVAARDEVIRAAAASLPQRLSIKGKAERISLVFLRYRCDGWRRDCALTVCPDRLTGLERFAWAAFRLLDSEAGLSVESIRKKLVTNGGGDQLSGLERSDGD